MCRVAKLMFRFCGREINKSDNLNDALIGHELSKTS